MPSKPSQKAIEKAWVEVRFCAAVGLRCPPDSYKADKTGDVIKGLGRGTIMALAAAGKIRAEVYAHNFRRITVLVGPHAGKSTAPPPGPVQRPYKVTPPPREERRHAEPERSNLPRRVAQGGI